jgi:organic radical activating enzyme
MIKGRIAEVFDSVQGEGIYLGEKQIFVRFFGCNLRCKFCDTKLNYFTEYTVSELLRQIQSYPRDFHSISFTGGEPLLQKDFLKEIVILTKDEGYKNYLETNGVLFNELNEIIDYLDIIAMDYKLPSSTGDVPYWRAHQRFLEIASLKEVFVKMVISNATETEDVLRALNLIRETNRAVTVVLQPNSNENGFTLDKKIDYYKALCEDYALATCKIPQLHKLIGAE